MSNQIHPHEATTLTDFAKACETLSVPELSALLLEVQDDCIEVKSDLAEAKSNGSAGRYMSPKDYAALIDNEGFVRRKLGWLQNYEGRRRKSEQEAERRAQDATVQRAFIEAAKMRFDAAVIRELFEEARVIVARMLNP